MDFSFILDITTIIILAGVFIYLWREKRHFYSLKPFIGAAACLISARLLDTLFAFPDINLILKNVRIGYINYFLWNYISNLADVFGVVFLATGLVKTIKFQIQDERKIKQLESFLSICPMCKKFRNEYGVWKPIEDYIVQKSDTSITHGFCPECAAKVLKSIDGSGTAKSDKI
jgi:hypothetical protein